MAINWTRVLLEDGMCRQWQIKGDDDGRKEVRIIGMEVKSKTRREEEERRRDLGEGW